MRGVRARLLPIPYPLATPRIRFMELSRYPVVRQPRRAELQNEWRRGAKGRAVKAVYKGIRECRCSLVHEPQHWALGSGLVDRLQIHLQKPQQKRAKVVARRRSVSSESSPGAQVQRRNLYLLLSVGADFRPGPVDWLEDEQLSLDPVRPVPRVCCCSDPLEPLAAHFVGDPHVRI